MIFDHSRHALHTPDCNECHLDEDGEVVKSGHLQCRKCHSIKTDTPSEKCLLCHNSQTQPRGAALDRPVYTDVDMDHGIHAKGGVGCKVCHGDVAAADRLSAVDFISMEACVKCHFPRGYPTFDVDCGFCHAETGKHVPPSSHEKNGWTEAHGTESRKSEDLCRRCHLEKTCAQCHRTTPPAYHTIVFKKRGHGIRAAGFPDKCEVCHSRDFCKFCHLSTQPTYHTAAFKSSRPYTHCGMCHLPLDAGNRCGACHEDAPHDMARAMAVPPPPFVDTSLPCLPCHPVGLVPIRHLYNTIPSTECTFCHI